VHLVFSAELSRDRVEAKPDSLAEEVSKAVLEDLGGGHHDRRDYWSRLIGDVERLRFRGHFDLERLGFRNYLDLGGGGFSRR
jgi:hypothetical protein